MHVDDCAEGMIFLMNNYSEDSHINLGFGSEITILELAKKIKEIVGFSGKIVFDKSKPDGIKRKLLNSKKINDLGWRPKIDLEEGLKKTYKDYKVSSKI